MLDEELEQQQLQQQQQADEDRGDVVDPDLLDDEVPSDEQAGADQESELELDALKQLAGEDEKSRTVPHARFNEVNESLKAEREARLRLEEELARARGAADAAAQKQAPSEAQTEEAGFDFDDAERRVANALFEGDADEVSRIRAEIRAAERAELERMAAERAEALFAERMARAEQEKTRTALERAAEEVVAKYTFLDVNSVDADEEAIDEVVGLRDIYIKRGATPVEALQRASERVAKLRGVATESSSSGAGKLSQEQISQSLEREGKIPPRGTGVGDRATRINYTDLTEEEFEKMSESEKRKARGDFI